MYAILNDPLARALIRAYGATVVVVEVRASTGSYDRALGRAPKVLELSAVLAAPSHDDSRYRVIRLGELRAEDEAAELRSMAIAEAVATHLGAAFDPPDRTAPRADAPRWLTRQGPPQPSAWKVTWTLRVWRQDGVAVDSHGSTIVTACRGYEAHYLTRQELVRGLTPPFDYSIALVDIPDEARGGATYVADAPVAAPPADDLRRAARSGQALSVVLAQLAETAPTLSPLERMITIQHAFLVDLELLEPVGAFCRGELCAGELDRVLGPLIDAQRPHWSLRLALAEAHVAGRPLGPVLRDARPDVRGVIPLCRAMDETFGLRMGDTKELVSLACDGAHDDEFERVLGPAIQRGTRGAHTYRR